MPTLTDRLARAAASTAQEWRVQHPDTGNYCAWFDHGDNIDPERAAREWLAAPENALLRDRGYVVAPVRQQTSHQRLMAEAVVEIEQLRAALANANEQAERFERGWYLRGDALESINAWKDAYPHATSGLTTIIEQGLKA